jgi:hypothetical protein
MTDLPDDSAPVPPRLEWPGIVGGYFGALAALFNERTFRYIRSLGIRTGWRCWEAGAGGVSVLSWLCQQVGPTGYVLASDVDMKVLTQAPDPPYEVCRHDLSVDPPPSAAETTFSLGGIQARNLQRGLTMLVGPHLLATGQVAEDEIRQHLADLDSTDLDVAIFPVVSAWGRKPLSTTSSHRQ